MPNSYGSAKVNSFLRLQQRKGKWPLRQYRNLSAWPYHFNGTLDCGIEIMDRLDSHTMENVVVKLTTQHNCVAHLYPGEYLVLPLHANRFFTTNLLQHIDRVLAGNMKVYERLWSHSAGTA